MDERLPFEGGPWGGKAGRYPDGDGVAEAGFDEEGLISDLRSETEPADDILESLNGLAALATDRFDACAKALDPSD